MADSSSSSSGDGLLALPLFTQFHIALGFLGVTFGSLAILCRLPEVLLRGADLACRIVAQRHDGKEKHGSGNNVTRSSGLLEHLRRWDEWGKRLHGALGMLYLFFCLFMPVTSNWIWPRMGTPYMVLFFIASMYLALALGIAAIRLYRWVNQEFIAKALLQRQERQRQCPPETSRQEGEEEEGQDWTAGGATPRHVWLKYLHGVLMIYSYVMLVGAGQAFTSNGRVQGFPYSQNDSSTDSLLGRCFGRDLTASSKVPTWLKDLACGMGAYCAESSQTGGANPYAHGH